MFYEHNPTSAGDSQLLLANDGVVTSLCTSSAPLRLVHTCVTYNVLISISKT